MRARLRLSDMVPNFLRGPFGIEAHGTTQLGMISLSENEIFAALEESIYIKGMRNVSKVEFRDELRSSLSMGNMRDESLHLPPDLYIDAIGRAIDHLYNVRWSVKTDTSGITGNLIREMLTILPKIPQDQLAEKAQAFRNSRATMDEYAAQQDEVTQRSVRGIGAVPFPGP